MDGLESAVHESEVDYVIAGDDGPPPEIPNPPPSDADRAAAHRDAERPFVAINSTTQMDLQGQAASESAGHRHISGTGGQAQFVRGAYASTGGKSFICMSSTYERHGARASRVVLDLTLGNVITTTRADMMYVVTEYGMVNLKGKSIPERARAMISIAHPEFRDELEHEARAHGLIPRGAF
jgi:acyl-CoA hydrolase